MSIQQAMPSTTTARTFETGIDIQDPVRRDLSALLNQRLADLIDLFNQTKYAHWNVKGRQFYQTHELFDNIAERVEESCDLVAERAVTLGAVAQGTTRQVAGNSTLGDYDLAAVDATEHLRALAAQVARTAALIRKAIVHSAELGDPTTSDLFTEVSRQLDKDLWFLEAHLQG